MRATDGKIAPWQLSWRGEKLGGNGGKIRMLFRRSRYARNYHTLHSGRLEEKCLRLRGPIYGMRIGSTKMQPVFAKLDSRHAELSWILGCICPIGALERMTQYKDKARKHKNALNSGLLYYPVLMAADILIYNADLVPVGEDQKQHIELTRDLAQKFNSTYSETFKMPEPYIPASGARIMSLQNPESKMSKSDPNQNGTLYITDKPEILRKKIMSAVTDSDGEIKYDPDAKPGISNLINIASALSGKTRDEIVGEFSGKGYGDFKKAVAEIVVEKLSPVRERYESIISDKHLIEAALKRGNENAQRRVNRIMSKVYRKVGFMKFE